MKIFCIRSKNDNNSFDLFKKIGIKVYEVDNLERTDEVLLDLIQNEYTTIFLTNEVAGFSEDIIKKYYKNRNVNIIISSSKRI